MDVGALFLIAIVIACVVTFVTWPILKRRRIQQAGLGQELSSLLADRDRILKEIQELDFDHSLGKIPADEYPLQRQVLVRSGVDVLRRIDSLRPAEPAVESIKALAFQMDTSAEAAERVTDDDLEMLIAERRASRKEKTGGFCPKCGKPFMQSDQFCSCCGQPLGEHA